MEQQGVGFRILALSATPVSKIENLQAIVEALRVSKFEVRDENDEEVKRYTYDKNIVEVLVERENTIQIMEGHIHSLMNHLLAFLKQANLVPHNANPCFINKMTILNLQNDFRTRCANGGYGLDMIGAVFQRTGGLMGLIHAKKLL
jgi:ERCC4-related helicase